MRRRGSRRRLRLDPWLGSMLLLRRCIVVEEGKANTLVAVANSLGRRLPRMPFPPISKDANFDYESALDEQVREPLSLSFPSNKLHWLTRIQTARSRSPTDYNHEFRGLIEGGSCAGGKGAREGENAAGGDGEKCQDGGRSKEEAGQECMWRSRLLQQCAHYTLERSLYWYLNFRIIRCFDISNKPLSSSRNRILQVSIYEIWRPVMSGLLMYGSPCSTLLDELIIADIVECWRKVKFL